MKAKEKVHRIDQRFQWKTVDGLSILFINTVRSTEEEKIAMVYRLSYHGTHFPEGVKKAYLLIKTDGQNVGMQPFRHVIQHAKKHNYFEKAACYGQLNPIWIAAAKIMNQFLKNDVRIFRTEKEAIQYLKK